MQLKIRKFKLSEQFLEPYKVREVPWGPVGYVTYKRTYARRLDEFEPDAVGTEEWWQTCRRVIEGMFNMQKQHVVSLGLEWNDAKAQRTAKDAYERLFTLKWTPPGRGLWMMGTSFVEERTAAGLFNCFSKDTPLFALDKEGLSVKTFEQIGENQEIGALITQNDGSLRVQPAVCKTYGEQDLYTITFRHNWGKSNYRFEYTATKNHRWLLADGTETTALSEGDIVKITPTIFAKDEKTYNEGYAHGLIFGDGYRHNQYPNRHMIRLCSDRDKQQLSRLESLASHRSTVYCDSNNNDPFVTMVVGANNYCKDWKSLPTTTNLNYLKGFVEGWICADSWEKPSGTIGLDTQSAEAADWVKIWAPIVGYTVRGYSTDNRPTNFGERSAPLNRITLSKEASTYKVESIEYSHKDNVWCLEVQNEAKFTLAGGLVTGNCAFRSTRELQEKGGYLFRWIMDALMLGIGVGFDTLGAGTFKVQEPGALTQAVRIPNNAVNEYLTNSETEETVCIIADSREGWVESIQVLLDAYIFGAGLPSFDYTRIREKGAPIKGFGGTSSGFEPLRDLHVGLIGLYQDRIGEFIQSVDIVDTENLIGKCVVAGNVRRSAALALGQADDRNYLTMKNDKEKLYSHRWGSNNSFHAKVGMDYTWHAAQSQKNGEPGYIWLDNARTYGRMKDPQRFDDTMVMGFNPCVTGDTWVASSHGYRQVKELIGINGLSLRVNGRWYNALSEGFWHTGNKSVYKLETKEGFELKLTKNHKVLTQNRGWIEAGKLTQEDRIILHNHRENDQPDAFSQENHDHGFIVGLLVGDGTFANGQAVLSFWDEHLCDKAAQAISRLLPNEGLIKSSYIAERNEWRIRRSSITKLANQWGIFQENKHNIDSLMNLSDDSLSGFIKGLFDADGSVQGSQQKGVSIRLTQSNLSLLKTIQRMLLRFGIVSKIYKDRRPEGDYELPASDGSMKLYHCKAVHELVIANEDLFRYRDIIDFASPNKQAKLSKLLSNYKRAPNATKFYARFESLTYIGEEDVYDVTVEDVHAFDANGLYVHNCVEQQLEDGELCCLTETFPARHESYEDYLRTLKIAYLYAKTVTLSRTQWGETNAIMLKNRRIGLSMSGVVQAFDKIGRRELFNWCDNAYDYVQELDGVYSDWLCIPRSKRTTSIKPSGTVSLLNGSTPGIHFPEDEYYIRRIRFADSSELLQDLEAAGYPIEDDAYSPNTKVVSFPVQEPYFVKGKREASMWEQLEIAAAMQHYWADNSVSVTVTFKPEEGAQIKDALQMYESKLKAVSFLKYEETGYVQAPYEPITKEEFEKMSAKITPIQRFGSLTEGGSGTKFCDGDACDVSF